MLFLVLILLICAVDAFYTVPFNQGTFNPMTSKSMDSIMKQNNERSSNCNKKTRFALKMAAKEVVTKADLLDILKDKSGLTKKDVDSVLAALTEAISEQVLDGGKEIRLRDFGTFKQKVTKARMGRNPRTGEAIPVSGSTSVGFSAATAFKKKNNE